MRSTPPSDLTLRAKSLRKTPTRSEARLWSLLRSKQLSNLKFRRQHPVEPYVVDFACIGHRLIVEIDGGYHDYTDQYDSRRESFLKQSGWRVLRFTDQEVLRDVEGVGIAITAFLGGEYWVDWRVGR